MKFLSTLSFGKSNLFFKNVNLDLIGHSSEIQECSTKKKFSTTLQKLELYLKSYVFPKKDGTTSDRVRDVTHTTISRCMASEFLLLQMLNFIVECILQWMFYYCLWNTTKNISNCIQVSKTKFSLWKNCIFFKKLKLKHLDENFSSHWKTCHWVLGISIIGTFFAFFNKISLWVNAFYVKSFFSFGPYFVQV